MKRTMQPINFKCDEDALGSKDFTAYAIKNEHDGDESVDLFIYGVVGGDMFDEDPLTAMSVAAFLAENRSLPVNSRINTPGGSVFEGITIYNALVAHDALVTTIIEGQAASAGSIIAMAGDTIKINENASFMLHRAWGMASGNTATMADYAQMLNRVDGLITGTYAARTGLRKDTVAKMMVGNGESDGTTFTAAEAKAKGFADEIIPNKRKAKAMGALGTAIADSTIDENGDHHVDVLLNSELFDQAAAANEARHGGPDADGATPFILDHPDDNTIQHAIELGAADLAGKLGTVNESVLADDREREARTRKLRLMEIDGHAH